MFVNMTAHPLSFVPKGSEAIVTIPPSGQIARAEETLLVVGEVRLSDDQTIPVVRVAFGSNPDNAPWVQPEGAIKMVSGLALKGAGPAALAPYTGPHPELGPVRKGGQVRAVRAFVTA